ncbi:hypothetical protein BGZ98_009302 [Dissophora globulifera]|nr:hypothetical protein BGZ98_009302 [Dissophora globulifera]
MDTDQSTGPPPLPAKLRWRPYSNGSSKKNSKLKRDDTRPSVLNSKAAAHKIKGQQYYSGKPSNSPVGIKLQWEEAETIESMSHGGHLHDQHQSDRSRDTSPSNASVISSTSSSNDLTKAFGNSSGSNNANSADSYSNGASNPFTYAFQRALGSLPSPPLSARQNTKLDLVGGPSDLNQYKASIPGLTANGQQLGALSPDNAYQIALSALFESQSIKGQSLFFTPALLGTNGSDNSGTARMTNNSQTAAPTVPTPSAPVTSSSASALLGTSNISMFLAEPDRVLSNQELLGVASIDELLSSCGYVDSSHLTTRGAQMLASPAKSDRSLNASPMTGLLDYNGTGNISQAAATPSSGSFSPMALNSTAFETLLTQPVIPRRASQQQQQQLRIPTTSPVVNASAVVDPYDSLLQELSSPFGYISSPSDPAQNNAPTAWPSLFPSADEPVGIAMNTAGPTVKALPQPISQRSEMATQTDGPYVSSPSPSSTKMSSTESQYGSQNMSPHSVLESSAEEELDPDWLNFLDEASPLFEEVDMPSPPLSDVEPTPQDRNMWRWAEDLLKPAPMTPGSNHGFPTSGSGMNGMLGGSLGNGGLITTLQGSGQQKAGISSGNSNKSGKDRPKPQAEVPREGGEAGSAKIEVKNKESQRTSAKNKDVVETDSNAPKESSHAAKDKKKESNESSDKSDENVGGLVAMIRSLWIGGGKRGDGEGGSESEA